VRSFEKQATGLLALVLGMRVNNHTSLKKIDIEMEARIIPIHHWAEGLS